MVRYFLILASRLKLELNSDFGIETIFTNRFSYEAIFHFGLANGNSDALCLASVNLGSEG